MSYMGVGASGYPVISAKTANYSVHSQDHGKIFTNRGATGSVTFTLPGLTEITAGWNCRFMVLVDEDFVITAPADKLTAYNDATATSITFGQTGEQIGAGVEVVYDGTTYLAFVFLPNEACTYTVA